MALGKKHTCYVCSIKFYDLGKPDPICPKCGADQRENPKPEPKHSVLAKHKKPARRPAQPTRAARKDDEISDEVSDFSDDLLDDSDVSLDDDGFDAAEDESGSDDDDYD